MMWFWTKGPSRLQVETRYDNHTAEFVVIVESTDGDHSTERFKSMRDFKARLVELEHRLESEHWTNGGPPLLAPDGFPNRRVRDPD